MRTTPKPHSPWLADMRPGDSRSVVDLILTMQHLSSLMKLKTAAAHTIPACERKALRIACQNAYGAVERLAAVLDDLIAADSKGNEP